MRVISHDPKDLDISLGIMGKDSTHRNRFHIGSNELGELITTHHLVAFELVNLHCFLPPSLTIVIISEMYIVVNYEILNKMS